MASAETEADDAKNDDSDEMTFAPDLPQGIAKELLQSAQSDQYGRPQRFDEVTIHYVCVNPADGVEFDSSRMLNDPVTFKLGKQKVIPGWEFAIVTMRRGEVSRFTVDPEFTVEQDGSLPRNVPVGVRLVFEIELVDYKRRKDLFGDGGVIKTNLKVGSSQRKAKQGAEVIISYKVTAADGALVKEQTGIEYKVGSESLGQLSRVVDKALCSCKKGTVASLECTPEYSYGAEHPAGVTIELCLEEVYETEDVSWSWRSKRTALKKCIREGIGDGMPEESDNVRLLVESATDGAEPLPGFSGPTELEFNWGDGEVAEVFEMTARCMKRRERARLMCRVPSLCCEGKIGLAEIQATKVEFVVELVDFQQDTIEIFATDANSRFDFAVSRKDVGARLFKEQRYMLAFDRYAFVVKLLTDNWDKKSEEVDSLVNTCQLNQAACLLKVNDLQGAIRACTIVLDRKPRNVKALFRRATAHHGRKEHMEAIRDLSKALELEPQNVEARRLLQQAKQAQREEDKSSKAMFAKMCKQNESEATPEAAGEA